MIALNHVLAGTAIGLATKNPLLAAPLAFALHYLLDALPHYDYGGKPPSPGFWHTWIIDAIASTSVLLAVALDAPELAAAAVVGGLFAELPDVLHIYHLKAKKQYWFFRFHAWVQWSETKNGLFYELGYLIIFALINLSLLGGAK